jgi:ribose 1,5-bisphosphokinase PhnN
MKEKSYQFDNDYDWLRMKRYKLEQRVKREEEMKKIRAIEQLKNQGKVKANKMQFIEKLQHGQQKSIDYALPMF